MLFDYTFLTEPILLMLKFILDNLFIVLGYIQQLPQTVSSFLHLHFHEVLLLYGIIGFCLFSIHFKRGSHFVLSLVCFVFLQISQWNDSKIKENRSQMVFYSVNKHSVFGFVEKDKGFFLSDSDFIKDKSSQNFNLNNHWSYLGLNNPQLIELNSNFQNQSIWKEDCHIQFGNKKLVLVNKNFELKWCEVLIEIDYCLVSHYFPVDKLLQIYCPKRIILDANLPSYIVNKLSKECSKLKISMHDLKSKGALLVDLKD